jgi:thiosulfate dehydrogenase
MNEIILPLFIVGAIGLTGVLILVFKQLDRASNELLKSEGYSDKYKSSLVFLKTVKYLIYIPLLILGFALTAQWLTKRSTEKKAWQELKSKALAQFDTAKAWEAPDPLSIKQEDEAKLIQYGRDLITHTSDYLGPEGIVKPMSNGMNCQNCHLDAGSKP